MDDKDLEIRRERADKVHALLVMGKQVTLWSY